MSEIIYTKINPKAYVDKKYFKNYLINSGINIVLLESIKRDGIKFPILGFCNDKKINGLIVGTQRIMIAFKLGLIEVPTILYSLYNKTGFKGEIIRELNDVVKLCGKDIIDEPVYNEVRSICNRIKVLNV